MNQKLKPWQKTTVLSLGALIGTIIASVALNQLEKSGEKDGKNRSLSK